MPNSLYDEVRSSQNLFAAWRHVKRSASRSKNNKIRGHASEFEHQHQTHIKTIQTQLQQRRFVFDHVEGVLKDKREREALGKDPRPIAIGTIRNRVVQRAILQTLQPRRILDPTDPNTKYATKIDERLGKLNQVNRSTYGIGGLMAPYGGVKPGILQIMKAMEHGAKYFFQSDIKAFFTKIPTEKVVDIVRTETGDAELAELFEQALEINLANKDELAGYAKIFPSRGIGVAQGSSLSAFAGNVLLYDFDHALNEMGVTAIRYIDDVFLLGRSAAQLDDAVKFAKETLNAFGFSLYKPAPGSTKAAAGECRNSFTFLGCTIQPPRCVPSVNSKDKILADVHDGLSNSKRAIKAYVEDAKSFDPKLSRSATLDRIGKKLYGWQKSFSYCTSSQVFREIDLKVFEYVTAYDRIIHRITESASSDLRMQALGIPNTEQMFLRDQA